MWYSVQVDQYPYVVCTVVKLHQTEDYEEAKEYIKMFQKEELRNKFTGECTPIVIFSHKERFVRSDMKRTCTLYKDGSIVEE